MPEHKADTEAVVRRCSVKKGALRNFAKFTRKHLCQRFFFNKVAGLGLNRSKHFKKGRILLIFLSCFDKLSDFSQEIIYYTQFSIIFIMIKYLFYNYRVPSYLKHHYYM